MDINLSGGGGSWDGYQTAREIIKLFPHQLIYSASSNDTVDNRDVDGRPMFNGHLGKAGIAAFIKHQIEKAVSENKIAKI